MTGVRWPRGQLGLRGRLVLIGVVGMALGLAFGSLVLYRVLVYAVDRTLDDEALTSGREVVTMVEQDKVPAPLPVSGAQVVQVVDVRGRVVAGSVNADRLVPLLDRGELARGAAGQRVLVSGARAGVAGPLQVRVLPATSPTGPVHVLVALQVGDVLTSRAALRQALLVTNPLLVLVLALIAWRVIGWTLRPVEALRVGAERISGRDRSERLPVPGSADEIRALALTLNTMLDRLAEARSRQQSFVADAAHELRSPLASIRTQLEVAQHLHEGGTLPAELMVDVSRLAALVEDLLLLARADADRRRPATPDRVPVAELLAGLASSYASARVPVTVEPEASGELVVEADPSELRRALANLVDNAVRHASTAVRLGAAGSGSEVLLTVTDDGLGIAAADRERVFSRFTRLDHARDRDAGGSGLGLAIVRELVSRAGGTVRFTDPGPEAAGGAGAAGGARAEIRLPTASDRPVADGRGGS